MKSDTKKRTLVPFRRYLVWLTAILMIVAAFSCSVEKNTSLSRNYHNLTSHYNIYFNGIESYKKGLEKAETSVKYNYTSILPIFLYEDESLHSSLNPTMRRAIEKATKVITFHSIDAKPKVKEGDQSSKDKAFYERNEYNKWVDDSYMLMGKAYMYQGEFFLAAETFKHILVTFPVDEVRFLAMTWLARAYIMIGETREADRLLIALEDQNEFPEEYMGDLHTTRSQFDLKRESYASAATYLESALLQKDLSKDEKIRFTFILAQLYEEAGENTLAQEKYRRVTRYNPPYEMAFNARVSMAEVFESGSENSEELKKLLNKMLRDSKNREYKDQIYFALGNIALEEGDRELAIEYYRLSVSTSIQNQYQKGFSSLTLAEIYYEEPDYMLSAAYYDSAVSFLNRDYPGYTGLITLSTSLSGLVYNVNTYTLEDSMQMLAALPEEQRFTIIDGIIEDVRLAEEEARLMEQQTMQDMAFNQSMMYENQAGGQTAQRGGKWYFYNLNARSFGQPEFRMKWGERKLEDNWRRKNKQTLTSMNPGEAVEGDTIEGGAITPIFDNKSREFYLATIPLTDSSMGVSNHRLEEALFNMGVIYKENLLDYQEAIDAFEELVDRFPYPEGKYNDRAIYYLYELYNSVQKPGLAESYKGRLLAQYPESHFTKLLTNPNYIKELEEEEMKVVRIYETIYAKYQSGDYQGVILDVDSAVAHNPEDPLVPKFIYIKALSVGALIGKEEMKTELDSLISWHPGTEESIQAQEVIDYMYVAFPVIKQADEAKVAEEIYTVFDPDQEHYFMLALQAGENVNQVSFDLLNYNLDNFNEYNLEIERLELTDGYYMLVVQIFTNADGAGRYLEVIQDNSSHILAGIPESNYRMMIISQDNYTTLSGEKVHNPYYLFYLKHYLKQE
ncbi:MAG: tetratricopeptide repeat protein [Bacteroidetes bacterium]|nr:tetratricopeptide repeat protein [Bacteroidota bacterium]